MDDSFVALQAHLGDLGFIALSFAIMVGLCFFAIPWATDLMTNSAAGLAGKYFGKKSRSLVINASTNNPEAASMAVGFALGRVGGIANPLGSLFANIYLMFLIAPFLVLLKFVFTARLHAAVELVRLMAHEWRLLAFHLFASGVTFGFGYAGMMLFVAKGKNSAPELSNMIVIMLAVLLVGIISFVLIDAWLKRRRPELYEEMSDDDHTDSWAHFWLGTIGVIGCTFVLNSLFLSWTDLYSDELSALFGLLIFVWLHWFLGALVTSLPELFTAMKYYEKRKAGDLHVALGSVSYSNFVNLCIAALGVGAWYLMAVLGRPMDW